MKVTTSAGDVIELGPIETSPTIGIVDYSRRVTDDYGVTTVVERAFSRRMSVRLAVPFDDTGALQRRLAALRATPATWTADDRFASLSVRGFCKDFEVDHAVPPLSYCTLTVEGLAETAPIADAGGDPAVAGTSTLRLLQPVKITNDQLVSSSVPETDAAEWSASTTYPLGARVIRAASHRIYESAIAGNVSDDPIAASGKWIDIGPTNRWAMFDRALGSLTSAANAVTVKLTAPAIQAVALLDVTAATVRLQATGYDRTVAAGAGATTFLDLPAGTTRVTVTIAGGSVSVGTLLVGKLVGLGVTEGSPTSGITDYSRKDVDDFGAVTIVERAWSKRMAAKSLISTASIDVVANRIAAVRAVPSLWIGLDGLDSLTVYGFFKEFSIEVGETTSKLSLSIEGLSAAGKIEPLGTQVNWPDIADPTGTKPADNADVTGEHTSKDTNAVSGRPASQVLTAVDKAKADIDGLVATFGTTASAAASANAARDAETNAKTARDAAQGARDAAQEARALAGGSASTAIAASDAAAQSKTDAQTASTASASARDAAAAARDLALGYRDAAQAGASNATSAVTSAASARDAAIQKANEAATSASSASGSATTASGQATIATQKADAAGQSASIASAKADTATSAAGSAGVSQYQAAVSEQNAAGSATAASVAQSITASTYQNTIKIAGDDGFENGLDGWQKLAEGGSGVARILASSGGRSAVISTPGVYEGGIGYVSKKRYPVTSIDQKFSLFGSFRKAGGLDSGSSIYVGFYAYDANGTVISGDGYGFYPLCFQEQILQGQWVDRKVVISKSFEDGARSIYGRGGRTRIPATAASIAPVFFLNFANGNEGYEIDNLGARDVTSELAAADAATASASSASTAATSQSAAGVSASAAQNSAVSAATSAGSAGVSQYNSAVSEQNAAGSANTATLQASVSASSASSANARLAESLPAQINSVATGWTLSDSGAPTAVSPIDASRIIFKAGRYGVDAGSGGYIRSVQALPAAAGTIYEITAEVEVAFSAPGNAGAAAYAVSVVRYLDAAFNGFEEARSLYPTRVSGIYSATIRVSDVADPSRSIRAWPASTAWIRIGGGWGQDVVGSGGRTLSVRVRDVTADLNSSKSATAAAGSASTAQASQTAAGQSASAAQASATSAATDAGKAGASSTSAAVSESSASGSKNAAAISASVSAQSADAAAEAAALMVPQTFQDGGKYVTWSGNPATYPVVDGIAVMQVVGGDYGDLHNRAWLPAVPGDRWHVRIEVRNTGPGATYGSGARYAVGTSNAPDAPGVGMRSGGISNEIRQVSAPDGVWKVLEYDLTVPAGIEPYIRLGGYFYTGNPETTTIQFRRISIVNVTQSELAKAAATASADSASSAATSRTAAGESASAVRNSETNASTSAGTATTRANEASTSAQTAAGSASSASASQQQAANSATAAGASRDGAAASADASAGSASIASTRADAAGQSATTATAALNAAKTAQGSAEAARDQAAQSRTDAAGSASSASGSATLAAGSATKAGQRASAAATSEESAAASSTAAGQQATASEASKTAAQTARGQAETFANQASTSKDSAAGLASTASTQAGLAAQSKTDAQNASATATGAATAANNSASTASTKADAAGASAVAANQSRIDAQAANGNASANAGAAATSAAAASASASSANTTAMLASRFSQGALSRNAYFGTPGWVGDANTNDNAPPEWLIWFRPQGGYTGKSAYTSFYTGLPAVQIDRGGPNAGIVQPITLAKGWHIAEFDVYIEDGDWNGTGAHVNLTNGYTFNFHFVDQTDTADVRSGPMFAGNAPNGTRRQFGILFYNGAPSGADAKFHLMAGWEGFGVSYGNGTGFARTIWHKALIRPADQGEIDGRKARIDATTNAARIEQVNSTLTTIYGALAQRTSNVEARAGNVEARTGIVETAVASATSKLAAARVEISAVSPGGRASMTVRSDTTNGAAIDFGADLNIVGTIKAQKTAGGKTITIDSDNGISFNNGSVMKVSGVGFGSNRQFIEWVGPSLSSTALCTEANALQYIKTDGSAYFGGSLSAGQLKNSSASSGTGTQELAAVGPFGSNGGTVKYLASWAYRTEVKATYAASQTGLQQYRQAANTYNANADEFGVATFERAATTVTLARSFSGSALEQLDEHRYTTETVTFVGNPPVIGDAPGSATITFTMGGGFTVNDPQLVAVDRTVRLGLNRGYTNGSGNASQRLSIIAVEG